MKLIKLTHLILKVINYKLQLLSSIIDEGKKESVLKTTITTEEMVHIIIGSFWSDDAEMEILRISNRFNY